MAMVSTSMVPVSGGSAAEAGAAMDWHAWLLRTRLDPVLAYQYGLLFARNELEEEDISHFDHEFLLSMGVSVAKHRLEILKLSKEECRRHGRPHPVARLLAAADRTRRRLVQCLRSLAAGVGVGGRAGSSALVPVRRRSLPGVGGGQWGGRKLAALKQGRLMLTDGGRRAGGGNPPPARYGRRGTGKGGGDDRVRDEAGEVRWDSMFQDLRPT